MASGKTVRLTAFEKEIKQALKLFDKPSRLGDESTLASYYLLSQAFTESADVSSARGRGLMLQRELQKAGEALWGDPLPTSRTELLQAKKEIQKVPGTPKYAYFVLELRCFKQLIKPKRLADIWEEYLPSSRAEHYRDFDVAITQLAQQLLRRIRPSFRLEIPLPTRELVGYESQIAQCLDALQEKKSVSLYGPSGVGKSAVAAQVAAQVTAASEQGASFWFTIRPKLNDRLENLLFSLGYFLHRQSASHLWNMLLLSNGKIDDLNLAMGLVREDLTQLADSPILLCIDDIEQLHLSTPEQVDEKHLQFQSFIESLQGYVSMLFIGHRPSLHSDSYVELTGLSSPHIRELYQKDSVHLDNDQLDTLYQHTNGNPRLLLLYKLLHQKGESLADLLTHASPTAALQPILNRLWVRLEPAERRLLQQFSVFLHAAPVDQWRDSDNDSDGVMQQLVQFRLVQLDGQGGISVVSALRTVIYESLSAERREQLHLEASSICLVRAEYTRAAYHFWQGGDLNKAVEVWYAHRQREISHGQALLAQTIFEAISRRQLRPQQRKALDIIRAELLQLQGESQRGLAALESADWSQVTESSLRARWIQGIFLDELGYPERAIETFQQGQTTLRRLIHQLSDFHYRAGVSLMRQHDKHAARKEAFAAQFNSLRLLGNLHEQDGDFGEAIKVYKEALALTDELDRQATSAAHRLLSSVYGRQQRFQESIEHAHIALRNYEEIGDRLNAEIVHSYLAATYLDMQQFENAAEVASKALVFFRRIDNKHFIATTGATAAEAYFELEDDVTAEALAFEVLDQEEPYAYAYAHHTLGLIAIRQEDFGLGEQHLQESVRYAVRSDDQFMEAFAQRALGQLFAKLNRAASAQQTLTAALRLFQQLEMADEATKTQTLIDAIAKHETN